MKLKFKTLLLAALLAIIIASSSLISFNAGFKRGFSAAYDNARTCVYDEVWGSGYAAGFDEGSRTGFTSGYKAGYREGYADGVADGAGKGISLRDPTYSEVEAFVEHDGTEELRYSPEGCTFLDLAARFKANSMAASFRCALAIMLLDSGVAALNAFNTTDKGLV